ncbi:MAG: alpha-L-rhamnosidase C-terminal domain-containing protein, partial [Bacteroidota bacterium]
PTYFLSAEILGVKPNKPGWEEILIAPHPCDLLWARGKVPTPRGIVSVEWKATEEFRLRLETPAQALVVAPLMKKGNVLVTDDQGNLATTVERLPDEGRYAKVQFKEPGSYRILST